MRAIFFFLLLFTLAGCASVEVVKEVAKAAKNIQTTVTDIVVVEKEQKQEILIEEEQKQAILIEEEQKQAIIIEKQEIINKQKKDEQVILKQTKITTLNLLGKTIKELHQIIGPPQLVRQDGQTTTIRFDSISCRIFVFMNSTIDEPRVEYYELRNSIGTLLDHQEDIAKCYYEIKKV